MLTVGLADKSGLRWAQEQVKRHHYLHTLVDDRCSPVAILVTLFDERVGCLIFGRPEATRVNGWYGSVEDVRTGKCHLTRWEVLNLARVWLDPSLQKDGKWYHPHNMIGPSILPGFYDRNHNWYSSSASFVINLALEQIVFHYLLCKSPVSSGWRSHTRSVKCSAIVTLESIRAHSTVLLGSHWFAQMHVR